MESGKMGARQTMAAVESALADRTSRRPARRASLLEDVRPRAIGLALVLAVSLLVIYGLARLGAAATGAPQIAPSSVALATAVWQGDGGTLQAVASPQGGLAIYRNAQRIAWIRGHSAAIVSAAFVDNGRAVLTLDANGQSRLTQIGTAAVGSAFEIRSALKALDEGLWRPHGAPVARAVYIGKNQAVLTMDAAGETRVTQLRNAIEVRGVLASLQGDIQMLIGAKKRKYTVTQIAEIQKKLSRLGLYHGEHTGIIDVETSRALKLFQQQRKLPVTGEIDTRLNMELNQALDPRAALNPEDLPIGCRCPLTEKDILKTASDFGVDARTIKALLKVQSRRAGFGPDGRLIILFEPHIFSRLTNHRFDTTHPNISYLNWREQPYPGTQAERWMQLKEAYQLDPEAAYSSTSYGLFQLLGASYSAAGFSSASKFALSMNKSEASQLEAFFRFLASQELIDEIRLRDWEGFARVYNGPGNAETYSRLLRV